KRNKLGGAPWNSQLTTIGCLLRRFASISDDWYFSISTLENVQVIQICSPIRHPSLLLRADLLYSERKSRGRFECILGTAPATHHSRGTFHEWPEAVRAIHRRARCPLCGLSETRRAVWLDMPESITSILIRN